MGEEGGGGSCLHCVFIADLTYMQTNCLPACFENITSHEADMRRGGASLNTFYWTGVFVLRTAQVRHELLEDGKLSWPMTRTNKVRGKCYVA